MGLEHSDELAAFTESMRRRRPVATWTLAAIILLIFGLEHLWGGTKSGITLIRMGALVPELVWAGEVWRLISSAFLHYGIEHFLFNTAVLLMLGSSLEKLIGTRRFLLVYAASALGGSVASLFTVDAHYSVGASGALWGLLAGEAVLGFRPRGLLPAPVVQRVRSVAITNLVLNLIVSFRPRVNMAAHLGGGAVGALLFLTGIATLGLLAPGRAATAASADSPGLAQARTPGWLRAAAALSVVMLAAGLAVGLVHGQAWSLSQPPTLMPRALAQLGITAEVPGGAAPDSISSSNGPSDGQNVVAATYGDIGRDPMVLEIIRLELDQPMIQAELDSQLEQAMSSLAAPEDPGLEILATPQRITIGDRPALTVAYAAPAGLRFERGVLFFDQSLVRVDVLYWPNFDQAYGNLMERVLRSIRLP